MRELPSRWTWKDGIPGKLPWPWSREGLRQRLLKTARLILVKQLHRKFYKKKQAYLNSYTRGLIASYPEYISDNIMNLSNIELSQDEYSILAKGLSFIPKPKRLDTLELLSDVNNFIRKICNKYHSYHNPRPNMFLGSTYQAYLRKRPWSHHLMCLIVHKAYRPWSTASRQKLWNTCRHLAQV